MNPQSAISSSLSLPSGLSLRVEDRAEGRNPPAGQAGPQWAAGFSLVELLFAIFIMGTALAMSAALFPTAMRENESSINDTVGTIICKSGLALARTQLVLSKTPPYNALDSLLNDTNLHILADEANRNFIPIESQHYPFGKMEVDLVVPPDAYMRGFVLLGRRINLADPNAGVQLIAVAYARKQNQANYQSGPKTTDTQALIKTVDGEIQNQPNEYRSWFVPNDRLNNYLRVGSPLILPNGEFAKIVRFDTDAVGMFAILNRKLPAAVGVNAFVVVEENTVTPALNEPVFSPAMATVAVVTALRQTP